MYQINLDDDSFKVRPKYTHSWWSATVTLELNGLNNDALMSQRPEHVGLLDINSHSCWLWCSVGTENHEAEDEYHRTAQASWVQRMFTSLFSDSALFNTREGRAGKVPEHDPVMEP